MKQSYFAVERFMQKESWLLALMAIIVSFTVAVLAARATERNVIIGYPAEHTTTVVQDLAVTPPLATAYDICQDSTTPWGTVDQSGKQVTVDGFQVAHIKQDDHYEGQLVQNQGQANQVAYHLFWRPDVTLAVVIEEARQGQATINRTDPHLAQFDNCVQTHKIIEVSPKS